MPSFQLAFVPNVIHHNNTQPTSCPSPPACSCLCTNFDGHVRNEKAATIDDGACAGPCASSHATRQPSQALTNTSSHRSAPCPYSHTQVANASPRYQMRLPASHLPSTYKLRGTSNSPTGSAGGISKSHGSSCPCPRPTSGLCATPITMLMFVYPPHCPIKRSLSLFCLEFRPTMRLFNLRSPARPRKIHPFNSILATTVPVAR